MGNLRPVEEIVVKVVSTPEDVATLFKPPQPGQTHQFRGRVAFALAELLHAGERGLTAIERPAYRWSDYIFRLRGAGIRVETSREKHGGPFAGYHARYRLATQLEVLAIKYAGEASNAT